MTFCYAGQEEESEVEGEGVEQSQTTVPGTTPEIAASKAAAQLQHEETLKAMEVENKKNFPAATPSLGRSSSEPLFVQPPENKRPPATPMNKGGKSKKGKGPKVKKTAVKSKAKKGEKKPRGGKPKEDNPFEQPPDQNQARLTFTPGAHSVIQPPSVAAAEAKLPEKPPTETPVPEKPADGGPKVTRQTTMEAMDAMLNRPDTQDLDDECLVSSLDDMTTMLEKELEKKKEEDKQDDSNADKKGKKDKKEKTPEEKSRHARRMRFFRSLVSHVLSVSCWITHLIQIDK